MSYAPKRTRLKVNTDLKYGRLAPSVLLLSDDVALTDFVRGLVKRPWKLICHRADKFMNREVLAQPNVRLAILDDQAVEENDRGRLLAQIRKHFSGVSLLYLAGAQTDRQRKTRARQRCPLLRFEAFVVRAIRAGVGIIFTNATGGRTSRPFRNRKAKYKSERIERPEPSADRRWNPSSLVGTESRRFQAEITPARCRARGTAP